MRHPDTVYGASRRRARSQEGVVLFMVILLVLLFSGLGLLAMRHTQAELRSANAYLDSTQAAVAAEAAIMMVATDMRRNWRYPNAAAKCKSYYSRFQEEIRNGNMDNIEIGFSDVFNDSANCDHRGSVPVPRLQGALPLALTGGALGSGYARVSLSQAAPVIAPPPPGFSSGDERRTYDWYYFTVTGRAVYGYGPALPNTADDDKIIRGNAVVRSHMKIGPVDSISAF